MCRRLTAPVACLLACLLAASAAGQSGGNFVVTQSAVSGGGGTSAQGQTRLDGTIGQPATGEASGGAFAVSGGFWPAISGVNSSLPAISINDASVVEGDAGTTDAVFNVALSSASGSDVTVQYATADGTATAPSDYTALPLSTLTIPAGTTLATITVAVNGDTQPEPDETFFVNLSNPVGATIARAQGIGTILNDDAPPAGSVIISEFRMRGPDPDGAGPLDGSRDEFVELYNNTNADVTVNDPSSQGWALVASDGVVRAVIPNGTRLPARGHLLVANNTSPGGYSLGAYAAPDITYTTDIPDGAGLALFSTADPAKLDIAHRLDAVGFASVADTLYREGAGLSPSGGINADGEYSFVRKMTTGLPQDTGDNAADFLFVSTDAGPYGGAPSVLGAPGPEGLAAPYNRGATIKSSLIDPSVSTSSPPNRDRDTTANVCNGGASPSNCTFGTLVIRRTFTNNTGGNVSKLRFRVVDMTSGPGGAPGTADVRLLNTTAGSTSVTGGGAKSWAAMTLEQPPAQAGGGGVNSTVWVGTVTTGAPLSPGNSVSVQFTLGVQQTGSFRFFVIVEALP